MSDTFVLASHLPIPKPELASFLKRRPDRLKLVRGGGAMFEGWGWDAKKSVWKRSPSVESNGKLLSGLALDIARGECPRHSSSRTTDAATVSTSTSRSQVSLPRRFSRHLTM